MWKLTKLHQPAVTIFGGARLELDSPFVKMATELAKRLSEAGFSIVTGGGPGVMEASTKGAKAGGQDSVIVVTYHARGDHKNYEDVSASNPYDEEIMTTDYFDRTKVMLQNTDIHIVFKGGTGTISEFGMTWANSRIHEGHHKPIVLFGEFWEHIIAEFKNHMHMRPGELELIKICTTPEQALEYVKTLK